MTRFPTGLLVGFATTFGMIAIGLIGPVGLPIIIFAIAIGVSLGFVDLSGAIFFPSAGGGIAGAGGKACWTGCEAFA